MFRSAVGAVLAIALSSSIASAQTFVPEAQTLAGLGSALAQPEPIERNLIISFDVAELIPPVSMEAATFEDAFDIGDLALPDLIENNLLISFDVTELALPLTMEVPEFDEVFETADFELPALIEQNLLIAFDFTELAPPASMEAATFADAFDIAGEAPLDPVEYNFLIAFDIAELALPSIMEAPELEAVPDSLDFTLPAPPASDFSVVVRGEIRPSSLRPMYAAQIALQAADLLTTFHALNVGHREANPLFKSGNRTAMVMAKVAAASLDILAAERMWKKNPRGAVLVMIVSNVVMSTIVANNIGALSAGSSASTKGSR
jgi:hypothetical protein